MHLVFQILHVLSVSSFKRISLMMDLHYGWRVDSVVAMVLFLCF